MQSLGVIIVVSLITVFNLVDARTSWLCTPCLMAEECNKEPLEFCLWGESRDACNRRVCSKGPGERCGGPMEIYGHCGEGMMCKTDERCHGCSAKTLDCFP